jgi:hypothetical protein
MRQPAVKPTIVDRVVMHLAPQAGLPRIEARAVLMAAGHGYDGAGKSAAG